MAGRLTARLAATATKPGRYGDGNGLYLVVKPSGAKSWVLRTIVRGRRCDIGLGGYPLVSLAEARTAAFENRRLARAGGDPLARKRRRDIPTFEDAARAVIEIHRPTWRPGGKSAEQWESSLRQYAFPRLGAKYVDTLTTADVMAVLGSDMGRKGGDCPPCSSTHQCDHEVGNRARVSRRQSRRRSDCGRIAESRRHAPASSSGSSRPRAGDAVRAVRGSQGSLAARLAFEFLVLTAARSGEVRGAMWSEFDLKAATWTIPGERMKGGRAHRVPLSDRALAILDEARALDDGSGLVFPSTSGRKPMSSSTLTKLLRELDIEGVPHGFRSTFRDWCSEFAQVPRDVAEACLAHVVKGVEGAYARSDLLDRRRNLMARWATYLNPEPAAVVSLHVRRTVS